MEKSCRIWSPVIMAELESPRELAGNKSYILESEPSRLEDLKVRIRNYSVQRQGRAIEVQFNIDVLALLETDARVMQLFSRQEILRDRLTSREFRGNPEDKKLDLILDLRDVNWNGELKGKEIMLGMHVIYHLLATRPQAVNVLGEEQEDSHPAVPTDSDLLQQLQAEIIQTEGEKLELKRKIHLYETDIRSLKHGVSKAESRNRSLYNEVHQYQQVVDQMRRALMDREASLNRYQQQARMQSNHDMITSSLSREENLSLGGIIKRLFQNNI